MQVMGRKCTLLHKYTFAIIIAEVYFCNNVHFLPIGEKMLEVRCDFCIFLATFNLNMN